MGSPVTLPPLPPGYTLDAAPASPGASAASAPPTTGTGLPPLPPGYTLDGAQSAPAPDQGPSLDPDYYQRLAQIESGGDPTRVNKLSGAAGLYQWMPATAKQYGVDPFNKDQSEAGIRKFTGDNIAQLTESLGRAPTSAEVYLAHQQGAAGAAKLLNADPADKAANAVGLDAVLWNGGKGDMSSADFAKMVENKYNATDPNSLVNSAAGFAIGALEPYSGVTTFRGGRGAAGPGAPRFVSGNGPAQQAVKDFGVGLAHGGIDVPLNTLGQVVTALTDQLPDVGKIGGISILGTTGANDAQNAKVGQYRPGLRR